jgi:radical SAM superfamily enzyme
MPLIQQVWFEFKGVVLNMDSPFMNSNLYMQEVQNEIINKLTLSNKEKMIAKIKVLCHNKINVLKIHIFRSKKRNNANRMYYYIRLKFVSQILINLFILK